MIRPPLRPGLLLAGLLCIVSLGGCHANPPGQTVEINGHVWHVELATTVAQRYQGLSGRTSLAEDQGMLFMYPKAKATAYCMRDCYMPIDIAFIDASHRVVAIHSMTVEPDHRGVKPYPSGTAVQYALEVAGGALARAGVKYGDRVYFGDAIPPAAKAAPGP